MLQYRAHGCVELCELLNVFWSGVMEIPSCNWLASDFFFWVSQWKLISINRYFNLFHTLWSFMFLIHDVHTPMSRSLKIFGRFDHATMLAVICKYDKYLHIFCLHKLCCLKCLWLYSLFFFIKLFVIVAHNSYLSNCNKKKVKKTDVLFFKWMLKTLPQILVLMNIVSDWE